MDGEFSLKGPGAILLPVLLVFGAWVFKNNFLALLTIIRDVWRWVFRKFLGSEEAATPEVCRLPHCPIHTPLRSAANPNPAVLAGRRFALCGVDDGSKAELLEWGKRTGVFLWGFHIEEQHETPYGHLLFCTYDCPFEEALEIHLLDEDLRLKDNLWFGGGYATSDLRNFVKRGPATFSFRFLSEGSWTLTLHEPRIGLARVGTVYAALGARPLSHLFSRRHMTLRSSSEIITHPDPSGPVSARKAKKKRTKRRRRKD
jgi:hypothetical protein